MLTQVAEGTYFTMVVNDYSMVIISKTQASLNFLLLCLPRLLRYNFKFGVNYWDFLNVDEMS